MAAYTTEEIETIKRMAREGKSRKEIADALPNRKNVNKKIQELYHKCEIDYIPKLPCGGTVWLKTYKKQ